MAAILSWPQCVKNMDNPNWYQITKIHNKVEMENSFYVLMQILSLCTYANIIIMYLCKYYHYVLMQILSWCTYANICKVRFCTAWVWPKITWPEKKHSRSWHDLQTYGVYFHFEYFGENWHHYYEKDPLSSSPLHMSTAWILFFVWTT